MKAKCENCLFSKVDVVDGYKVLCCHRHAPSWGSGVGTGSSEQLWPIVGVDDWCGEWEKEEITCTCGEGDDAPVSSSRNKKIRKIRNIIKENSKRLSCISNNCTKNNKKKNMEMVR